MSDSMDDPHVMDHYYHASRTITHVKGNDFSDLQYPKADEVHVIKDPILKPIIAGKYISRSVISVMYLLFIFNLHIRVI